MIALPWWALIALAFAFAVALAAALVVLIAQATREIRREDAWADVEGVAAAMLLGIEQQRPAVEAAVERIGQDLHAQGVHTRRPHMVLDSPVVAGGITYPSLEAWMRHLAEPTPIYDRLVAEQKAEEQAGIRRRVEELGIDWSVTE